ncbi:hypothetical protein EVAR_8742_1 [Eumeta japonica]|uniref:Uncharacterized protein n=1 Tax=Eumeta variegata TaxID=151549 RepID=A0A4C1XNE7_EUMVA|nr:hypothetical protein EVAR_8742_1 [Eumeta japonica]
MEYSRVKRAGEPSENRWSQPPMDTRNLRGVTSALLTSSERKEKNAAVMQLHDSGPLNEIVLVVSTLLEPWWMYKDTYRRIGRPSSETMMKLVIFLALNILSESLSIPLMLMVDVRIRCNLKAAVVVEVL